MKWIALMLFVLQVHASEQRGYVINTGFEYQVKGKIAKSQSTFILDAKNKAWTTLTEPREGVALLGRVVASDAKSLHMEYIVVDTTQKNSVVSTPAIVALLDEPASVEMSEKSGGKIKVSILARRTEYTPSK